MIVKDEESKCGLLIRLHRQSFSELMGESLQRMADVFVQLVMKGLERQIPVDREKNYMWTGVKPIECMGRIWTLASITPLLGSKAVKRVK